MKFLTNIDLSKNQLLNATLQKLATAPANPVAGQVYYNTADYKAYIFDGASWIELTQQNTDTITRIRGGVGGTLVSGDISLLAGSGVTISQTGNDITISGASGSIAFTGDVSGSGSTGGTTTLTLASTGVTAGTYKSVTVDAKGRVTAGSNPTTLSGYGITDAQPLDGDLTAISALTGTGILKRTGSNTWSLDTTAYVTQSDIDASINTLIGAAPSTLDTLNELATALGNDANFATTITNSLALKAPLASPALTGTPTAPTATAGTNTTQIATTAFVQSAISGIGTSAKKYTTTIGNGANTSFTITHNIAQFVTVQVFEAASPYAQVYADVTLDSSTQATISFGSAPSTNQYTVVVVG